MALLSQNLYFILDCISANMETISFIYFHKNKSLGDRSEDFGGHIIGISKKLFAKNSCTLVTTLWKTILLFIFIYIFQRIIRNIKKKQIKIIRSSIQIISNFCSFDIWYNFLEDKPVFFSVWILNAHTKYFSQYFYC